MTEQDYDAVLLALDDMGIGAYRFQVAEAAGLRSAKAARVLRDLEEFGIVARTRSKYILIKPLKY